MTDPWAYQRWAFQTPVGNIGRKAVLVCLAVMADTTTGRCEARMETIAQQVEAESRTVRRHLADLEKGGRITRRRQHRIDGRRRNDEYLLLAPWVSEWPDGELPANLAARPVDQRPESPGHQRPESPGLNRVGVDVRSAEETNDLSENDHAGEPAEDTFEGWLEHHIAVTGNRAGATPDTKARRKVETAWRERRKEYPDLDLRLVSLGAQADKHRRENGYTDAESVLRPSAVQKLAQKAHTTPDLRRSGATAGFEWDGDALTERTRQEAAARREAAAGDDDDGPEVGF